MTFATTKRMLVDDITTDVKHVEQLRNARGLMDCRVILAAHSNGGGLAQVALSDGDFQVKGLALLDATPPVGLLGVYWNWLKADPWFPLRVYPHLMHSRSPLSSTRLIKNAFFCDDYPLSRVPLFELLMSPFESLLWPMAMMSRFVKVENVLRNVLLTPEHQSVLILAAEKSRLMGVPMMRRMADEYEAAAATLLRCDSEEVERLASRAAVNFEVIAGASHHLQNDLVWRDGAQRLACFVQQLT